MKIKFIFHDLLLDRPDEVVRLDHLPRIGETVFDDQDRCWWVTGVSHSFDNDLTAVQLSTSKGK